MRRVADCLADEGLRGIERRFCCYGSKRGSSIPVPKKCIGKEQDKTNICTLIA